LPLSTGISRSDARVIFCPFYIEWSYPVDEFVHLELCVYSHFERLEATEYVRIL
jgi:hypothetical protein